MVFKFKPFTFVLIVLAVVTSFSNAIAQQKLKLWYKQPARVWTEALPLGNGRLGAMVYGRVSEELVQLNEATLWSGGPVRTHVNPDAYANLLKAREALFEAEDYAAANNFAKKMQGYYSESYMPLADLKINQKLSDTSISDYYRDLDINNAVATTRFKAGGITFTRQMLSSFPDQVMVIRFTSNAPGALNLKFRIGNELTHTMFSDRPGELTMKAKAPSHIEPNYVKSANPIIWDDSAHTRGMRYQLKLKAVNEGGTVVSDTSGITVSKATVLTLYLSAATSFNGFDKSPVTQGKDEGKLVAQYLNNALKQPWLQLLNRHIADYQQYYNRMYINFGDTEKPSFKALATDERLLNYTQGAADPEFEALYFQYDRYLLISSSRPGGVPANLQGIWNNLIRPPWSSNYTTNINAQMNYWPAEPANLSEMVLPFLNFIKGAAATGKVTAREFYHTRGWAMHHNSDIWALSNPVGDKGAGDPMWANWAMGSPWLSQHLWWHYQFTQDKKYLRETAYPLMKGAARFCLDWLVPYKGYLVTAPSVSPENEFYDDNHKRGSVSVATTMDMSIIRDLFGNVINAADQLGQDKAFRDTIAAKLALLYPLRIGKKGNLQEWYKDWEDVDPHHRHVSHLFGLFPGTEISPVNTPKLAAAAKTTLDMRGDAGTGWSLAWKINFWARLLDGNHAYRMIRNLLHLTGAAGTGYANGGGSYVNLFDAHPPFQIDGNFGGLSGMCEMLLQSQSGEVHLLPALPDAWKNGYVSGLKARGGFKVSMQWKDTKLTRGQLTSLIGGRCKLCTSQRLKVNGLAIKPVKNGPDFITTINTRKGKSYKLEVVSK